MSLKDQMAADLDTVFLNTDELASVVTVTPVTGGAPFTCRMAIGDAAPAPADSDALQRHETLLPAVASLAEIRPKLIAMGLARLLGPGDRIDADDGRQFAVSTCRTDGLGALLLQLSEVTVNTLGHAVAR
jgi:hypothetical protein